MQKFSEYILNEKDFYKKINTMEYVSKKAPIFFDKSVIFKAMIAKLFIENSENYKDQKVRSAYGYLCGIVGIILLLVGAAIPLLMEMPSKKKEKEAA